MKLKFAGAILALLSVFLALPVTSSAQQVPYGGATRTSNEWVAANFGKWRLQVGAGGSTAGGSYSITFFAGGFVSAGGGQLFTPFTTNTRILVGQGATQETVTPSSVSGCGVSSSGTCVVTATFANAHGVGTVVRSGSGGLDESLNVAQANGGGTVLVDNNTGITDAIIKASTALFPNAVIRALNISSAAGSETYYAVKPTNTSATASGTAPVLTVGTGGLTSGAYLAKYAYVDINGQISTSSSESTQTATTTQVTMTAPAASAGQVGYIPYITANGGSTNTEIMVPLTNTVCKLSTIVPNGINACVLTNTVYGTTGSNAVITTNPTSTAKPIGNGTATDTSAINRTAFAYVQVGPRFPLPITDVVLGQTTQAAGNATYEVSSWNVPAGFFNSFGGKWRLCADAHVTSAANSETLTMNVYYGPYNNSDTKLLALVTTAFSGTGTAVFNMCGTFTTTATGTAGAIVAHGLLSAGLASTSTTTVFNDAAVGSSTSLPLTTMQQMRIEAVVGVGALGSVITFDNITLEPAT